MIIRNYKTKDKEQVKSLIKEVLKEIFGSAENLEDLDNINKNFQLFLVAEDNGEIIGTLGIKNEGDARISILPLSMLNCLTKSSFCKSWLSILMFYSFTSFYYL